MTISSNDIERDPRVARTIAESKFPLVFATISGAHLYGFASADSDIDIRGLHLAPLREVVGLRGPRQTVESSNVIDGVEVDLVTHDAKKFIEFLFKKNGLALENILAPLVAATSPEHEELKALAPACATKHHSFHYLGMAKNRWRDFEKTQRAKPLLYAYRALLTGLRLMRSGEIEANLPSLNEEFALPFIPDLIAAKAAEGEKSVLAAPDVDMHRAEIERLRAKLEKASALSHLPEKPSKETRDALDDLLVRLRVGPNSLA